jgi:hypothetical protein
VADVVGPRDLHQRLAQVEASQVEYAPVPSKAAQAIGMTLPSSLLLRANEVIE